MNQQIKKGDQMAVVESLAFMPVQNNRADVVVPQICTCCLKPTNHKRTVSKSSSERYRRGNTMVKSSHYQSLDFFTCPQCIAHEDALGKAQGALFTRMMLYSMLILALLYFMAIPAFYALGLYPLMVTFWLNALLTYVISYAVTYGVLHFVEKEVRIKPLPPGHVTYEKSVDFKDWDSFRFKNVKYAQIFYAVNKKNLERSPAFLDAMGISITMKPTRHCRGPKVISSIAGFSFIFGAINWGVSGILILIITRLIM